MRQATGRCRMPSPGRAARDLAILAVTAGATSGRITLATDRIGRRQMFRSLLLAVALLVAGASFACAGDGGGEAADEADIEAVVRGFYDAILDGDLARMEDTLSQAMDSTTRGNVLRAFNEARSAGSSELDVIRVSQLSVRVSGDRAEVDVVFQAGSADTVTLVRESSTWRIIDVVTHN